MSFAQRTGYAPVDGLSLQIMNRFYGWPGVSIPGCSLRLIVVFRFFLVGAAMDNLDNESLYIAISKKDPEFHAAITQAQRSLPAFRSLLEQHSVSADAFPLIKRYFNDADHEGVWLWLFVIGEEEDGFFGEIFEAPSECTSLKPGTRLFIRNEDVADWMLNDQGSLHGGFTLRLQRARQAVAKQNEFDQHVGVERYLPLPP